MPCVWRRCAFLLNLEPGKQQVVYPTTELKPYSSRPYNGCVELVTKLFLESDIFYLDGMFSMKMKWVRFTDSKADLEALLGKRSMTKMVVNGYGVLLVHHQGDYYLVKNKCPHQGAKLDHAQCEDGKIVCLWHHYGFDLKTGRGAGLYLENYPIEEREDGL